MSMASKKSERSRIWWQKQRDLNTYAAQARRERCCTKEYREKEAARKRTPKYREKQRLYAIEYRKRPDVYAKHMARVKVQHGLQNGKIKRPAACELCGCPDIPLADGRSGLRADHYAGYDQPLTFRFVCIPCDVRQERERGNIKIGPRKKQ